MKLFPFHRRKSAVVKKKNLELCTVTPAEDKEEILNSIILESLNESEREKEQILNSLAERVCYLDLDRNIKWINSSGLKLISDELAIDEILGNACYRVLHGRDEPCESCPVSTTIKTGWPWKEEISHPAGATYLVSAQPVFNDNGELAGVIEVQLDISIRKEIERSLERSRMRSRALLDLIPDLLIVFNDNGRFIDYHPAADFDLLDYDQYPEGKHISEIMPAAFAEKIIYHSIELAETGDLRIFEIDEDDDNDPRHFECRLVKTDSDENVCIIRDISFQRQREKDILFRSFHDSLTGLYNRAYFEEELSRIEQSRQSLPTSILIIDVNGLKFTNDAFGHDYGDKLLKKVGRILSSNCRKGDVIARTGGDEFAIILPKSPLAKAEKLSERILKACDECSFDDFFARPSVSIGFAEKIDDSVCLQQIMRQADEKMYRMKLENRGIHLNALVSDIVDTMKSRSYEDENHIQRCTRMSVHFAHKLNLSAAASENIAKLAALHDIGKIRISKDILIKSGELTAEEHEQLKQHSIIGYRIAKAIPDYSMTADHILYHHERWDGAGYPSGLSGKEIPLEARVFMLIDSFDAMTHDSPFRKALSFDEAVAELRDNSGTQFDPDLVEIFIDILDEERNKNAI